MLFWIVAGTLAALFAWILARPLLASAPEEAPASPDQAIYRDQLAEVDRDLARGILAPAEAERARTEIARRLLAADRAGPVALLSAPRGAALAAAALGAAVVVMGSLLLYSAIGAPGAEDLPRAARLAESERALRNRLSQADAEARAAQMFPAGASDVPDEYRAMIEELRSVVPTRPDDLQGWELLALHEARLGNYAAAARAQERVVALKGEEATAGDYLALADRMVAAAGGIVTPESEAALAGIESRDPGNLGLLYYRGLLEAQVGRYDLAFPLWRAVVEGADPESLHYRLAAGQIEEVAWRAGEDYALPAASGPSQEEIAAAEEMDPEARAEMIRGMVDQLSARLASEGGPPEDWARLIASLGVLGDRDQASAILAEARTAFAASPEAQSLLDQAAESAGLSE